MNFRGQRAANACASVVSTPITYPYIPGRPRRGPAGSRARARADARVPGRSGRPVKQDHEIPLFAESARCTAYSFAHRQSFCSGVGLPLLLTGFFYTEGTFTSTETASAPQCPFGLEGIELYTTMLLPGTGKRAGQGGERKGRLAKRHRPETNRARTT